MLISNAYAQGAAGADPTTGLIMQMAPLILVFIVFYFLLIRPQQRQRKELEKRISSLQKGDEVVTTAGIHAIVHNVKERTVVLKVAEGVLMEFDKPSVATVLKKDVPAAK